MHVIDVLIFVVENVHDLDHDLYSEPRSNLNIAIENPYVTSYLMAIVMLTQISNNFRAIRSQNVHIIDLDL